MVMSLLAASYPQHSQFACQPSLGTVQVVLDRRLGALGLSGRQRSRRAVARFRADWADQSHEVGVAWFAILVNAGSFAPTPVKAVEEQPIARGRIAGPSGCVVPRSFPWRHEGHA